MFRCLSIVSEPAGATRQRGAAEAAARDRRYPPAVDRVQEERHQCSCLRAGDRGASRHERRSTPSAGTNTQHPSCSACCNSSRYMRKLLFVTSTIAGRLAGCLPGCLLGWLAARLSGCLSSWLASWLLGWLAGCLPRCLLGCLLGCWAACQAVLHANTCDRDGPIIATANGPTASCSSMRSATSTSSTSRSSSRTSAAEPISKPNYEPAPQQTDFRQHSAEISNAQATCSEDGGHASVGGRIPVSAMQASVLVLRF
jgi:hypothetical protein